MAIRPESGVRPAVCKGKITAKMKQRRGSSRYEFIAEAEIAEIGSPTKIKAKTADLSLHGCFLSLTNPCPEGTEIRVRISHEDATFTAIGRVVFCLPDVGMGVMFTTVDASQLTILLKWIGRFGRGADTDVNRP